MPRVRGHDLEEARATRWRQRGMGAGTGAFSGRWDCGGRREVSHRCIMFRWWGIGTIETALACAIHTICWFLNQKLRILKDGSVHAVTVNS